MSFLVNSIPRSLLAQRKEIRIPPTNWFMGLLVSGVLVYIYLAILVGPEHKPELHFRSEEGAITALSAIFLAMASGFAGVSFFLSFPETRISRYFWLIAALGLGFLALDELLGFHERLDDWITAIVGDSEIFRNWNDLIVIGYGLIAIPVFLLFLPEIFRYPKIAETLAVAFLFFCIHTAIDSVVEPPTTVSVILEESAKLFSAAFFATAMFISILGTTSLSKYLIKGSREMKDEVG